MSQIKDYSQCDFTRASFEAKEFVVDVEVVVNGLVKLLLVALRVLLDTVAFLFEQ